jgi:hypothetical protein
MAKFFEYRKIWFTKFETFSGSKPLSTELVLGWCSRLAVRQQISRQQGKLFWPNNKAGYLPLLRYIMYLN